MPVFEENPPYTYDWNKENEYAPHYPDYVRGTTCDQWIPITMQYRMRKTFQCHYIIMVGRCSVTLHYIFLIITLHSKRLNVCQNNLQQFRNTWQSKECEIISIRTKNASQTSIMFYDRAIYGHLQIGNDTLLIGSTIGVKHWTAKYIWRIIKLCCAAPAQPHTDIQFYRCVWKTGLHELLCK